MSEDRLRRHLEDDRKAFESQWSQFAPKLYTIAYRILGSQADAQEVLKKTCIKFFHSLPPMPTQITNPTRVYGLTVNACRDFLRVNERYKPIPAEVAAPVFPETDGLSLEAVLSRRSSKEVFSALYALPTEYIIFLVLCDMEGLSYEEVSLSLGFSLPAIRTRLSAARLLLLSKLCALDGHPPVRDDKTETEAASASCCAEFLPLLTSYMDGSLPKTQVKSMKAHLENCPLCRTRYAAMQSLRRILQTLPVPPMPASTTAEAVEAVKNELELQNRSLPRYSRISIWPILAIVAVCMLIFTLLYNEHAKPARFRQRTVPYMPTVHAEKASPSVWPRQPFGPYTPDMPSPTPTALPPVSGGRLQPASGFIVGMPAPAASVPTDVSTPAVPFEPYNPAPGAVAPLHSAAPSVVLPSAPEPTAAPSVPTAKPTAAPNYKVYPTVSSLVKRSVTFVVDDAAAGSLFQNVKHQGVSAVKNAFYENGITFSTRENVMEEYAADYNALANEATELARQIAHGQGGNLSFRLSQTELAMQRLEVECSSPVLYLSYQ